MPTVTDTVNAVASYLREMGYTASSMKASSFDAASEPDGWVVSGTFQDGFLGGYYRFDIVYEPDTGEARRLDVVEIPPRVLILHAMPTLPLYWNTAKPLVAYCLARLALAASCL